MNNDRYSLKQVITEKNNGILLRDFLFNELNFSNRLMKRIKSADGKLLVNGNVKTVRYMLEVGDTLEIVFPSEQKGSIKPEKMCLDILFEDEYLLVIDKEPGIATIPSKLHPTGTLANGIAYYYKEKNIPFTVHIVTRLDKDTSGLVLVAKHHYSHSLLSDLQRKNEITRIYRAIVHGSLPKSEGTINAPIGRNPDSIIERMVRDDGKKAITHYRILREIETFSDVEINLETGRTHQIRVHFSYIGHPLVGDDLYGGKKGKVKRQALHCSEIQFTHPFSKKEVHLISNLPEDMENIISKE